MTTARSSFWPNLSLALLLCAIVASWFWLAPPDPEVQLAYTALATTTVPADCSNLWRKSRLLKSLMVDLPLRDGCKGTRLYMRAESRSQVGAKH